MDNINLQLAPAKVNLGLNVIGKRPDAYHLLQSLFVPISLFDEVELLFGSSQVNCSLSPALTTHLGLDRSAELVLELSSEANLVSRAISGFLERASLEDQIIGFNLKKRIPIQAGLGGGSADAACVLRALNRHFEGALSWQDLMDLAGDLGADVPAGLLACPLYGHGVGENLIKISKGSAFWKFLSELSIVVVKPQRGVSTKEAFEGLSKTKADLVEVPEPDYLDFHDKYFQTWLSELGLDFDSSRSEISGGEGLDLSKFFDLITNDFEKGLFSSRQDLRELKETLISCGSQFNILTGSGSSMLALFDSEDKALAFENKLKELAPSSYYIALSSVLMDATDWAVAKR